MPKKKFLGDEKLYRAIISNIDGRSDDKQYELIKNAFPTKDEMKRGMGGLGHPDQCEFLNDESLLKKISANPKMMNRITNFLIGNIDERTVFGDELNKKHNSQVVNFCRNAYQNNARNNKHDGIHHARAEDSNGKPNAKTNTKTNDINPNERSVENGGRLGAFKQFIKPETKEEQKKESMEWLENAFLQSANGKQHTQIKNNNNKIEVERREPIQDPRNDKSPVRKNEIKDNGEIPIHYAKNLDLNKPHDNHLKVNLNDLRMINRKAVNINDKKNTPASKETIEKIQNAVKDLSSMFNKSSDNNKYTTALKPLDNKGKGSQSFSK